MEAVFIVGIVFGSLILFFALVFGFVLALKRTQGGTLRRRDGQGTDETQLIQEIHQGLSRMEERVEALETILLEREREKKRKEVEE